MEFRVVCYQEGNRIKEWPRDDLDEQQQIFKRNWYVLVQVNECEEEKCSSSGIEEPDAGTPVHSWTCRIRGGCGSQGYRID
jgi:hypothetical protein